MHFKKKKLNTSWLGNICIIERSTAGRLCAGSLARVCRCEAFLVERNFFGPWCFPGALVSPRHSSARADAGVSAPCTRGTCSWKGKHAPWDVGARVGSGRFWKSSVCKARKVWASLGVQTVRTIEWEKYFSFKCREKKCQSVCCSSLARRPAWAMVYVCKRSGKNLKRSCRAR